jgi:hypothetical protein
MCESDSPFRGRNPVWRGLVITASLEFANPFISNAIALTPQGEGARRVLLKHRVYASTPKACADARRISLRKIIPVNPAVQRGRG